MIPQQDARQAYRNFESALAQFIQQQMPWPELERSSDEANAAAWAVAKAEGPMLWAAMQPGGEE